jgi:multidrug efflux system membrane fusion protein
MERRRRGRLIGAAIVAAAVITGLVVLEQLGAHPRTDDAEVFANFIGIAPDVSGHVTAIYVQDNQLVRKGQLLFQIDPLPYQFALQQAQSQQAALEGQILDLQRELSSERSAVLSARARRQSIQARLQGAGAQIQSAQATVAAAQAELARAQANYRYADNSVLRLEPLLAKQFVTVDQVDQARTSRSAQGEAVRVARAHLELAQAQWAAAVAARHAAQAQFAQSGAELEQSMQSVALLDPLTAQRAARAAAVQSAAYDLARCKVYAPFDARVTNLTLSAGAYAHVGQQLFTLIDVRRWWAIANFRETQLREIRPGMKAVVYVMASPHPRYAGTVQSSGFGVTPDPTLIGSLSAGLPDVQRSLDWVHLATRFPVRVLIDAPDNGSFRIGGSAMVVVMGH